MDNVRIFELDMGKVEVMRADIADAAEILAIYAPYVLNTAISFEYQVPSLEEFAGRIRSISEKYPYIKAVCNGKIVGYAYATAFKTRKAYDHSVEATVYIKEDCRQSGLGRIMYEVLADALKSMGVINMNACIALAKEGDPHLTNASMHFHEKMGFSLVGTFHECGYKFEKWYDMIWMEKMLTKHVPNPEPVKFGQWFL